jgi:hypothetical protein
LADLLDLLGRRRVAGPGKQAVVIVYDMYSGETDICAAVGDALHKPLSGLRPGSDAVLPESLMGREKYWWTFAWINGSAKWSKSASVMAKYSSVHVDDPLLISLRWSRSWTAGSA